MSGLVFRFFEKNGTNTVKVASKAIGASKKVVKSNCEFFVAIGLFGRRIVRGRFLRKTVYYVL